MVQEVIKEISSSRSLDASRGFKVVVISDADKLSKQAQAALRRTMEMRTRACRIILCSESPSKIISPLRSRCLGLRVPAPQLEDIASVLTEVARKEGLDLPKELAMRIADTSGRNLRRALLMLQAARVESYPFRADQQVRKTDWEMAVAVIASLVIKDQGPQTLLKCRSKIYELLVNCIPAELIMAKLADYLMENCDDSLKIKTAEAAAFYSHGMTMGQKDIIHIEALLATSCFKESSG